MESLQKNKFILYYPQEEIVRVYLGLCSLAWIFNVVAVLLACWMFSEKDIIFGMVAVIAAVVMSSYDTWEHRRRRS